MQLVDPVIVRLNWPGDDFPPEPMRLRLPLDFDFPVVQTSASPFNSLIRPIGRGSTRTDADDFLLTATRHTSMLSIAPIDMKL